MNSRFLPALLLSAVCTVAASPPPEPKFRHVTIDSRVQIGYGVAVADVDGDKLQDILLADKKQFVWYRNPGPDKVAEEGGWQKFILAENLTEKDNVCIAAQDIDGDGKCEVAVGAEWNPMDTVNSGAVFYLIPPADRTQPWQPVKLHAEPTTHRMRWIRVDKEKWGLVVAPLHGRGNINGKGDPVRVLLYKPPAQVNEPASEWTTTLVTEALHQTHNFDVSHNPKSGSDMLFIGGEEGIMMCFFEDSRPVSVFLRPIDPSHWSDSVGFGELRMAKLSQQVVSIRPLHGNTLVVSPFGAGMVGDERMAKARVLTDQLTEGHALACGDVLGAGADQVVVGWRGKPGLPTSTTGVAVWTPLDASGMKWRETLVDGMEMACEDLQLADLNEDGKLDIVASGRATKNLKIYLNETPAVQR